MKFKYLGIIAIGLLVSCTQPQQEIKLKALDNFFDRLLQNSVKVKQCLKYEDCPEWDGNPDTKVYYDLMKGQNGTGKVETDFNWNLHLYTCHLNELLDSINGKGHFEKLALISAKDGMIPCPIGVNPHWDYDWEEHIIKFRDTKEAKRQLGRGLKGQG